jgi:hypothetical protein
VGFFVVIPYVIFKITPAGGLSVDRIPLQYYKDLAQDGDRFF